MSVPRDKVGKWTDVSIHLTCQSPAGELLTWSERSKYAGLDLTDLCHSAQYRPHPPNYSTLGRTISIASGPLEESASPKSITIRVPLIEPKKGKFQLFELCQLVRRAAQLRPISSSIRAIDEHVASSKGTRPSSNGQQDAHFAWLNRRASGQECEKSQPTLSISVHSSPV